jgi:tRNA1Val (adenine37-N6)-methyltransferase
MANPWFQFKQFLVWQDQSAMKVTTDGCLFGGWASERVGSQQSGVVSRDTKIGKLLDIGTGTGLLSLMLAQQNPGITIDAIEIDKEAARQAKQNADESPWKDRINIIHADAKTFISPIKYDCIISNPPFYEKELKSENNQKNLAYHSDELSLSELLKVIKNNLAPGGSFFLLLPFKRDAEIKDLLLEHDCRIIELCFVRQSSAHGYFRIMLMATFSKGVSVETAISEITIKDSGDKYTPEFIKLLEDYYLYL